MEGDPDALWKPGFTGEVVYEARPGLRPVGDGAAPQAGRSTRRRLAITALIAIPAASVCAIVFWPSSDPSPQSSAAPRIPTSVSSERWSATSDVVNIVDVAATANTIVLAGDFGRQLVALDADDGTERWRRPIDTAGYADVEVLDGTVIAIASPSADQVTVSSYDLGTGERMWFQDVAPPATPAVVRDRLVSISFGGNRGNLAALTAIDPVTGQHLATVAGRDVCFDSTGRVFQRSEAVVTWFGGRDLRRRGSIDLRSFGAADALAVVVAPRDDDTVVVAAGSTVRLLDASGNLLSSLELTNRSSTDSPVEIESGVTTDDHLLLGTGEAVAYLVTVVDGDLTDRWQRSGSPVGLIEHQSDHVLATTAPDLSGYPSSCGGEIASRGGPIEAVDAAGATIWSGNQSPALTESGFVVADDDLGSIEGIALDGTTMWSRPSPAGTDHYVGADALVEVFTDIGSASTIVSLLE